jgi:hypothetical protein
MLRSFSYLDTDVVDDFLGQLGAEPPDAPTPASRFARLVDVLRDRDELAYLDTVDEARWDELMRGDVVEAEVVVRRGQADGVAGVLEAVGRLAPAVGGLGSGLSGLGLDEPARSLARAFTSASSPARFGGTSWVTAELAAAPTLRFAVELRHGKVLRSLDDLDGEATLVGKVRRFVTAGQPAPAPGAAPAVVLTPVALFR